MQALAGLNHIPAMTTEAERALYYRLVRDGVEHGAIVELGAWLGASTAYIAAAIRDSGAETKAHVYDRFQSKPGHAKKVQAFYANRGVKNAIPMGPCLHQFRHNLGPLAAFVDPRPGQIEDMRWRGGPISVLITDAPKRVPQISAVLTELREALQPGAIMAWQDFCHFPSYEIPACLYRLREHLEFVDAVVPGTTLVFRVRSQWTADEVSLDALALPKWTPAEIGEAWAYWLDVVPAEKRHLFECGAAMFLCDIEHPDEAVGILRGTRDAGDPAVAKKWAYLRENRRDFVTRYAPLFDVMSLQAA